MAIQSSDFEQGALYVITTTSGEVNGVVKEIRSDQVLIGPDSQAVSYSNIINIKKVNPTNKMGWR
ncbi:hypothetical protein JWR97_16550 [Pseudomonas cedrina subsp. fulgida]|nr:hypothetical protein [Pseudomonas cedrina subsp. fulgida]